MSMFQQNQQPRVIQVQDLRVGGVLVGGSIISCTINMGIGEHDEVALVVRAPSRLSYIGGSNQLMYFTWGLNGRAKFYGYVTEITPQQEADRSFTTYSITAQGPTFVLKGGQPRFFTDMSVADVCAQLCAQAQLGFRDEYGTEQYDWRQLAQTSESDWSFLNNLSNRIGADLICCSGVVRLVNPVNVLMRSLPLSFATRDPGDGHPDVYDFVPTKFTSRLPSQVGPAVSYLSNGQTVVLPALLPTIAGAPNTSKGNLTAFSADRPCRNKDEAVLAQIRLSVDWEEQGTVRLQGMPGVEPGSVLALHTSVGDTVKTVVYDGYWYVLRVTHQLNQSTFQSNCDLARVTNAPRLPPVVARFWYSDPRGRPQMIAGKTGTWISSWR